MSAYLKPLSGATLAARSRARADAGTRICAMGLLVAFFLRASSIPTPLNSSHLFLACCGGLVVAFVYMLSTRVVEVNSHVGLLVVLVLPSLLEANDSRYSVLRLFGWTLVVAVVGPLFTNEVRLKIHVLKWTRILLPICAVGSLAVNLAGCVGCVWCGGGEEIVVEELIKVIDS